MKDLKVAMFDSDDDGSNATRCAILEQYRCFEEIDLVMGKPEYCLELAIKSYI